MRRSFTEMGIDVNELFKALDEMEAAGLDRCTRVAVIVVDAAVVVVDVVQQQQQQQQLALFDVD